MFETFFSDSVFLLFLFQGCKGEEETRPRGFRLPGEGVLGCSQATGRNTDSQTAFSFTRITVGLLTRRGLKINHTSPLHFPGYLIISTHDASLPLHVQSEEKGQE